MRNDKEMGPSADPQTAPRFELWSPMETRNSQIWPNPQLSQYANPVL